jgi:hypothetical protein
MVLSAFRPLAMSGAVVLAMDRWGARVPGPGLHGARRRLGDMVG